MNVGEPMNDKQGMVFNIQKFSIHDGPGIRTTVFLKGCMLHCLWCHNPESQATKKELMLYKDRCVGCGSCLVACPQKLHSVTPEGAHLIDRGSCVGCGLCADSCVGALELVGREMTAEEVLTEVMKDEAFYRNSGGGMTLSGGEPLMQPGFTRELLKSAKDKGLHTCIETCGYSAWENVEALLPYVDLFLWDVKETDSQLHREFTGVSNARILENLRKLNAAGAKIILRCPVVPGFNDRKDHFVGIAALAEELENVLRVDVEPYHPLGKSKSQSLGRRYELEELTFPAEEMVAQWVSAIAENTTKPVVKS